MDEDTKQTLDSMIAQAQASATLLTVKIVKRFAAMWFILMIAMKLDGADFRWFVAVVPLLLWLVYETQIYLEGWWAGRRTLRALKAIRGKDDR